MEKKTRDTICVLKHINAHMHSESVAMFLIDSIL